MLRVSGSCGENVTGAINEGFGSELKKRVLFALTVDEQLQNIDGMAERLVDAGWDVQITCSPGLHSVELSAKPGVDVIPISIARNPSLFRDLVSLFSLVRLVLRTRPSLVVAGSPKAGLLGLIAAKLLCVPNRIYVLHGLRLETSSGALRWVLTQMERVTIACSTEVIPVSRSLRHKAIDLVLGPPEKFSVVASGSANGVDVGEFDSEHFPRHFVDRLGTKIGLIRDTPVIGFVGRLTLDKGMADLEAALHILKARGILFQLLLVGRVDDESGAKSLQRLQSMGFCVTATGFVERPAIYFQLMDVFCLPSLREGLPTVVLEASASGIPVVVSNATGSVDAINPGVTGLIYEIADAETLADNLATLLEDRELAQAMGTEGARWVRQYFDREPVQTAYLERYEQAVAS